LRFLARLPREVCANLLNLHVQQVDENACAAAPALVMSDMLHYEEVSR
jgi:hypothetical protein